MDSHVNELNRIGRRYNEGQHHADPSLAIADIEAVKAILQEDLSTDLQARVTLLLAQLLFVRHEQGDPKAIETALQALGPFESAFNDRDDRGRMGLTVLRDVLLRRAEMTGELATWRRAVRVGKKLVRGGRGTADDWSMLAMLLSLEYARSGLPGPLHEATAIANKRLAGEDSPMVITRYASIYGQYAVHTSQRADFDRAVNAFQTALVLPNETEAVEAVLWTDFGSFLMSYTARYPLATEIDEAVSACAKALELTPAGHPERAARLANWAAALVTRFEQTGDVKSAISNGECITGSHKE